MSKVDQGAVDERLGAGSVVVGVDIGGTKTALMVNDLTTGEDLAHDRFPTPSDAGSEAMIGDLKTAIRRLVEKVGRNLDDLASVGVAVPGQVDARAGRVLAAGNLRGWDDVPLRDILCRDLGVPVFVEQDANAAALGERWRGSAKEMNNFVFLALGTGIGAGVMINGRLHRGFHYAAGEVGNFILGREYLGQNREGHGNLELLVGGPEIRHEAKRVSGEEMGAADALHRAGEDKRLARIADEVADYLAIAVINMVSLLDPEAIVFGGGTSSAGEDLLNRVRSRVERELSISPALIHSVLGEDAQLHGAVFGALWELDPNLALREELR